MRMAEGARRAEDLAWSTVGVTDVVNQLRRTGALWNNYRQQLKQGMDIVGSQGRKIGTVGQKRDFEFLAERGHWAGDVVPQKAQTNACLAGFHCASAPHAGHENFFWAVASAMRSLQELVQRRFRHPPGGADLLALELALFQAGQNVRLAHPQDARNLGSPE